MKTEGGSSGSRRVVMWLENNGYPQDGRVRREAETLTRHGYSVTVVCPRIDSQPRNETCDDVEVHRYRLPRSSSSAVGYVLEYLVAMVATAAISARLWLRARFDVIHAHNPPDLFALVAVPFKLVGVRFVFDHHDLSPEMYRARFDSRARRSIEKMLRLAERFSFFLADHVVVTNDSYRQVALSRGGLDPEVVTVVRNGPALDRVRPMAPDPDIRATAGTVIGYVGEIGPQDGVDHLLRALAVLRDELGRNDFFCLIVGDGDAVPSLVELAADLDLNGHVSFMGRVEDAERVMTLLSSADICVDPDPSNPYNDRSSMIKLTEYMALGKPIVAFDLPEHRVTCGEAAAYASPNDDADFAAHLSVLMEDADARASMGRVGRERVERALAWHHQAPRLLEAYDVLLGSDRDTASRG